jgi:hypothetical protein
MLIQAFLLGAPPFDLVATVQAFVAAVGHVQYSSSAPCSSSSSSSSPSSSLSSAPAHAAPQAAASAAAAALFYRSGGSASHIDLTTSPARLSDSSGVSRPIDLTNSQELAHGGSSEEVVIAARHAQAAVERREAAAIMQLLSVRQEGNEGVQDADDKDSESDDEEFVLPILSPPSARSLR